MDDFAEAIDAYIRDGAAAAFGTEADEQTLTPGLYFHGSPHADLDEFKSQDELRGAGRAGVYFSRSPSYAASYASGFAWRFERGDVASGGRIYTAELVTRNQLIAPDDYWERGGSINARERAFEQHAIDNGIDCVVTLEDQGIIAEIIVLERAGIRLRGTIGAPALAARNAVSTGIFYALDGLPGPAFAPECPVLFSSRTQAESAFPGERVIEVGLPGAASVYCDRIAWLISSSSSFREVGIVDCLIDPADGLALMINRERIFLLNRAARRAHKLSARSR